MQTALAPGGDAPDPIVQTAQQLAEMLGCGRPIGRETLRELMTAATRRSDADGGWTLRDAYDALELACSISASSSGCVQIFQSKRPRHPWADDDATPP